MQYLLLIYADEKGWASLDEATQKAEMDKCIASGQEFAEHIQGSNSLQPTTAATTVRVRDGKRLITDGPFAETKEQIAGYYLVEAANLAEAIASAAKNPVAPHGSIEVRPISIMRLGLTYCAGRAAGQRAGSPRASAFPHQQRSRATLLTSTHRGATQSVRVMICR